jgi:hypothetical protein
VGLGIDGREARAILHAGMPCKDPAWTMERRIDNEPTMKDEDTFWLGYGQLPYERLAEAKAGFQTFDMPVLGGV